MLIKTFRDLIAWQKAMPLARIIYHLTRQIPCEGQVGLTIQMRRATVSIPSNIVELITQYELAAILKMLPHDKPLTNLLAEEDRIPQGLIHSLGKASKK